jgi:hypothetical protein
VSAGPAEWLAARSGRERALLTLAAAVAVGGLVLGIALALRADLNALEASVVARERELAALRHLAADLGPVPAETAHADTRSLVTRLETAAGAVVGRPRIAAMTPTTAPLPEGLREERVAVRLSDTSLGEVVRLLHGLESADPPLPVARLELRKHTDDPRHFEATVEVAQVVPGAAAGK